MTFDTVTGHRIDTVTGHLTARSEPQYTTRDTPGDRVLTHVTLQRGPLRAPVLWFDSRSQTVTGPKVTGADGHRTLVNTVTDKHRSVT